MICAQCRLALDEGRMLTTIAVHGDGCANDVTPPPPPPYEPPRLRPLRGMEAEIAGRLIAGTPEGPALAAWRAHVRDCSRCQTAGDETLLCMAGAALFARFGAEENTRDVEDMGTVQVLVTAANLLAVYCGQKPGGAELVRELRALAVILGCDDAQMSGEIRSPTVARRLARMAREAGLIGGGP